MNILDENIPIDQRQLLLSWRIRFRQIGHEIGRRGMQDGEIIPLLHRLEPSTFFTRDLGFFRRELCDPAYCLVCLEVGQYEAASFIRRALRHTSLSTQARRSGRVVRVGHAGIRMWRLAGGAGGSGELAALASQSCRRKLCGVSSKARGSLALADWNAFTSLFRAG